VNLWAGTALIGASPAIANVLLPAVIKRDFSDRLPVVTALFTAFLSGGGGGIDVMLLLVGLALGAQLVVGLFGGRERHVLAGSGRAGR
jgi:cyanate permease